MATESQQEEFRLVPGFTNYRVSNFGNVERWYKGDKTGRKDRSQPSWKHLNGTVVKSGHVAVILRINLISYRRYIHRLVLEAFIGPRPQGLVCCHNNGNPADNRLCNLRWDTQKSNALDKVKHGTQTYGEKCPASKLTQEQVIEIIKQYKPGVVSTSMLGKMYNTTQTNVWNIVTKQTWKHIHAEFTA